MKRQLTYLLVADGGTDRALVPIIEWAIHRLDPEVEILEPEFRKRRGSVSDYVASLQTGAMLVFVHRDSETENLAERLREFDGVAGVVPVVPVRMTEAWLLVDGAAIARAADRPESVVRLPRVVDLESLSDPKRALENLLLDAADPTSGRRLKRFKASLVQRRVNVAELTDDYSALERLPAFQAFQTSLRNNYPYRDPDR